MLPVCSASRCSSHSQILLNDGLRYLSRSHKMFGVHLSGDATIPRLSNGICPGAFLQKEAINSLSYDFVEGHKALLNDWSYSTGKMSDSFLRGGEHLTYVEESAAIVLQEEQLGDNLANSADILLEPSNKEAISILDSVADRTSNVPDTVVTSPESLSPSNSSYESVLSQTSESIRASFGKGETALNSSVDNINSTIQDIIKDGNEAIEKLTSEVFSSFDQAGELARAKLNSLSSGLQQSSGKAGVVALDLLRKTILVVEDSLVKGSKFVYYSYETSKEFLPSEIQNGIKLLEEKASDISRPVGMVFLQVYSAIEGVERTLGLDPSDPIVPLVLLFGTTSTL